MATSSIYERIVINNEKDAEAFIKAIEESERANKVVKKTTSHNNTIQSSRRKNKEFFERMAASKK